MMKKTVSLILLLLVGQFSFSQQNVIANAKRTAQLMIDNYLKKDYENYVNFLYPTEIKYRGGRNKFVMLLKSNDEHSKLINIKTVSQKIMGISKVYHAGKELHCAISVENKSSGDEGLMILRTTLLAISADQGKTWKFITTGDKTPTQVHKMVPKFNEDLMWDAGSFNVVKK
ncbi:MULTISPECIES: hypothetical protein [unclassified Pedobacter]|uniref:hypothetical protein n=1 Tax=unclassified Pedobacter TaxID=2628915 RepID=UPI00141DB0FF|nr:MULTISPECIES: hypothetical protein [unclassified Pedobacter]NII83646.1 hypothetical protein [Pedobacter sp. SG908]NMN37506.1 hypothetical protein [Pedobacter sp. SG918]